MAAAPPYFDSVGTAFVQFYYQTFDAGDRTKLAGVYGNESMLTFNGERCMGAPAILKKLTEGVSFKTIAHSVVAVDCQPSPGSGVLVLVNGSFQADQDHPMNFSQSFNLMPNPAQPGNYFVLNDIFRINVGI